MIAITAAAIKSQGKVAKLELAKSQKIKHPADLRSSYFIAGSGVDTTGWGEDAGGSFLIGDGVSWLENSVYATGKKE